MNTNAQIESLFKELKLTQQTLEKKTDPKEIQTLENYCEEIKSNIDELSSSCEIDYELIGKTILFNATANALMYRICNRKELHTIIQELQEIGVPQEVMVADKEVLTRYLRQINHPKPSHYERYSEFIKIAKSKAYRENPAKKREFIKDYKWLMNQETFEPHLMNSTEVMEAFQIDSSIFQKIIGDQEYENFESLIDRWHTLMSI